MLTTVYNSSIQIHLRKLIILINQTILYKL